MRLAVARNTKTKQLEEELKRAQDIGNNLNPKRELLVNIEEQIKRMLLAKYESDKAAISSVLWEHCEVLQTTLDKLRSGLEVGLEEVDRFISHPAQVQGTAAHVVWDGDQLIVTPTRLCVTRGADVVPRQERGQSQESGLPTTQLQVQGINDLELDKQSENMFSTSSSDTSNNYKERRTTSSDDCAIEVRSRNILCPDLSSLNG